VYGTKTPSSEATTEILVVRRNVRNQHRGQANKRSSTASRQRGDDNLFVAEDSDSGMAHRGADLEKDPLVPGHSGVHFVVPSQNDPKMKRLLAMYRHAKGEFNATIPRSLERTTAAKFLRDTTENCLAHIATQQRSASSEKPDLATSMANASFDGFTMEELEDTLKKTTAIAEKGSGGKKRRFDENWDNVPKGPSDKKSQQTDSTTRKADPLPQGRTVGVSTGEVVPLPPGLLGNANRGPHADSRPLEHRAAVMVEDCQRRYAHAEYTRRAPPHLSLSFNRQNMRRPFPKTDEEPGDRDARVRRGRADRYRPSYN